MKKAIGVSLLLLANIIILVHVIIPHHHHNGIPVAICGLSFGHNNSEHADLYHSHCNDGHERSEDEADEECALHKIYMRTDVEDLLSFSDTPALSFTDFSTDISLFCCGIFSQTEMQRSGGLPFRQKPYIVLYQDHYIIYSLGLRAPPSC